LSYLSRICCFENSSNILLGCRNCLLQLGSEIRHTDCVEGSSELTEYEVLSEDKEVAFGIEVNKRCGDI
jgi:hypothetical protein